MVIIANWLQDTYLIYMPYISLLFLTLLSIFTQNYFKIIRTKHIDKPIFWNLDNDFYENSFPADHLFIPNPDIGISPKPKRAEYVDNYVARIVSIFW